MDKFREGIVKMSSIEPNVPLSDTQNLILQLRVDCFMSGLQTTRDHPPYAWVVHFYSKVCVCVFLVRINLFAESIN